MVGRVVGCRAEAAPSAEAAGRAAATAIQTIACVLSWSSSARLPRFLMRVAHPWASFSGVKLSYRQGRAPLPARRVPPCWPPLRSNQLPMIRTYPQRFVSWRQVLNICPNPVPRVSTGVPALRLDRERYFCERWRLSTGMVGSDGHGWLPVGDFPVGRSNAIGKRDAAENETSQDSGPRRRWRAPLLPAAVSASASAAAPTLVRLRQSAPTAGRATTRAKTCLESTKVRPAASTNSRRHRQGQSLQGQGRYGTAERQNDVRDRERRLRSRASRCGKPAFADLEEEVMITFKKCKGPAGEACTTAGLHTGEIKTSRLEGPLGYVQESPPIISLTLENEANPGPEGLLAGFSCEASKRRSRVRSARCRAKTST